MDWVRGRKYHQTIRLRHSVGPAAGIYERVTRHVFEHDTPSLPQLAPDIANAIEQVIYAPPAPPAPD